MDAIGYLRETVRDDVGAGGGVVLAVAFDIANAFNSLPWPAIRESLVRAGAPDYLRAVIGSYLSDRRLAYVGSGRRLCGQRMSCGVPQGIVLGPTLWNLAHDGVLRTRLPLGCTVIGYADDTILLAFGHDLVEASRRAELAAGILVAAIRRVGVKIAPQKTEVMFFSGGPGPAPGKHISVAGRRVPVRWSLRYFGVVIDSQWSFKEHFEAVLPKAERMTMALSRLMKNMRGGGPSERRRRLYGRSLGVYVWRPDMGESSYCGSEAV